MANYNNDGYNRTFNGHAMGLVYKRIDIPDAALGIGWAEDLTPQPIKIAYELPNSHQPTMKEILSSMDASLGNRDKSFLLDEFPSQNFIGLPYGGDY